MIPVVVVEGPTASGKSRFALQLAKAFNTDIVSADSRLIYTELNIGTAKPSISDRRAVKHHLIDIINPNQNYSAGDFVQDASQIINELWSQGKLPLLCGGTMFYIDALIDGLFAAPDIPKSVRQNLQKTAREKGSDFLYDRLRAVDPESAARTHPNDLNRMIRALEIYDHCGKTITSLWRNNPRSRPEFVFFQIVLELPRAVLYENINSRVDDMFRQGLLAEFKTIIDKGYNEQSAGLNTVGYKELFAYHHQKESLKNCTEEIKKHTRNYAKRQLTWYRKKCFDLTIAADDIRFSEIFKRIKEFKNKFEENDDRRNC
jgi:tRNA dimethylallyltransferase